jgi:imidazolonepropionase
MVRQRVDLLVLGSNEAVTLNGTVGSDDLGIVDDGGVAVRRGRIVAVASSQLLERKFSAAETIEANDEIVMPGFVDPHTHLVFNGSREEEFQLRVAGMSYMDVLKKGGGILETVNKTRQAFKAELVAEGRSRLDNCLEAGSTTVEVKSGYGLRTDTEVKILETIRVLARTHPCHVISTFLGAHAIPREYPSSQEYARLVIEEMLPIIFKNHLAAFCDVFCEEGAFDAKESLSILRAAIRGGLKAKIHADEFSANGGTHVANSIGAVSADHLVFAPERELEKMVKTRVVPVVLPASSHSLLSEKRAKALEMLSIGLPVALGTDFSPANWVFGQLTVAALAARELGMRTADIIRGITVNAARAVGVGGSVGSLSPGKQANITILKVPNHDWIGYTYGEGVVDKVLIGGRVVVENGKRVR